MKRKILPITASLLLHLCLLLMVAINFNFFSHSTPNIGKKDAHTIHAYFYQGKVNVTSTAHKTTATPAIKQSMGKTASQTLAKPVVGQPKSQATATPNEANGQAADALVSLLHSTIQAAQVYPESALSMERSGCATVSFTLSPDGNATNLQLVKSSGTSSLDDAALDAIRHASPFQGVEKYLTQTKDFQIDVVFELPAEME